jgi:hypothetical protein
MSLFNPQNMGTAPGLLSGIGNQAQLPAGGLYKHNLQVGPSFTDMDYDHLLKQAAMTQIRTLPDWAWKGPHGTELSLVGLLYFRCQRFNVLNQPINPKVKFIVSNIQFIDAFEVEKDGEPHVAVVTLVGKQMVILHDADPLYPSDSLIAKIATLAET